MSRMKRIVGFSALFVALVPTLAGCSSGACPAVGYLTNVEVRTTGDFASLEACVAGDCVNSTDAPSDLGLFSVTSDGDHSWTIGSFQGTPDKMTLRTRDAAGAMISEKVYNLDWTRTGGSEQCGGPMETPAIDFAA